MILEEKTIDENAATNVAETPVEEIAIGDPGEGDKNKKPADRIPLPDYKNPVSRLDYAKQFSQKYGPLMHGRGDTPLRINEVPQTWQDKLTSKQIAQNASKLLGLDPALLYASAMEEGMSG